MRAAGSFRFVFRCAALSQTTPSRHYQAPLFLLPFSPIVHSHPPLPLPLPLPRFLSSETRPSTVEPSLRNPEDDERRAEEDGGAEEFVPATRLAVGRHCCDAESSGRKTAQLSSPSSEVEEFPEQWRRRRSPRLACLFKVLPSQKPAALIRILNAQRDWISQEDSSFIAFHCLRIREHETAFRVYKWMEQQRWFKFDFDLATKLADGMGKERKFTKCRDIFNSIIDQGCVPSESTFHILTVAYLSSPIAGCLDEACTVYNRMIQFGGYKPMFGFHNSLFRALVDGSGGLSNRYLDQAEFIYHNMLTSELEIPKEVYAGLVWLHSYQDKINRERIAALRDEMRRAGMEESRDVLVSIMRAFSKEGDVYETERAWLKILELGCVLPSQAFVYRMEAYGKAGMPSKSLEIFRSIEEQGIPKKASAYQKIIEVMAKAKEAGIAASLMDEFAGSGMKPLIPSFLDLLNMYNSLGLHEELETSFSKCVSICSPNRSVYTVYLGSLVSSGNLKKAKEIFDEMHTNKAIGSDERSSNIILGGFLDQGEFVEAEKIFDIMCEKKYGVEDSYMEKMEYILSLKGKEPKKPISLKLDKEQREILMGLLLGGVRMVSDEATRSHSIRFEFSGTCSLHPMLSTQIHERFYEWLTPSSRSADVYGRMVPHGFSTIVHPYFGFFADQFMPKGSPVVPRLIHRWLSPRTLAYWYMYGGLSTDSGDVLLKLKGARSGEDAEKIVKAFEAKSLACRMKVKGGAVWIAFQGCNADWFWKLVEPYVLGKNVEVLPVGLGPNGDAAAGEAGSFSDLTCDDGL